ncbi:MAG TPA: hypothetical protein VIK81_02050 [Patescibacteria group bacterium]
MKDKQLASLVISAVIMCFVGITLSSVFQLSYEVSLATSYILGVGYFLWISFTLEDLSETNSKKR